MPFGRVNRELAVAVFQVQLNVELYRAQQGYPILERYICNGIVNQGVVYRPTIILVTIIVDNSAVWVILLGDSSTRNSVKRGR